MRSTERGVFVKALGGGQVNPATGDFVFGMTEAYLIENGEITDPLREGNLIGNGPQVLTLIDAVGNDFAMGPPGMCGKDGQGVPVGDGVPTLRVTALTDRRHRGVTIPPEELLAIGDRIVGWANDGEQVEAVVVHSRDTEIRAYEGDVEQLSSAETQGVGIRVVRDQRVGFAYAGSLDEDVLAETLAEARDNAGLRHARRVRRSRRARRRARSPTSTCTARRWSTCRRIARSSSPSSSNGSRATPTRASAASSRPTTPTRSRRPPS